MGLKKWAVSAGMIPVVMISALGVGSFAPQAQAQAVATFTTSVQGPATVDKGAQASFVITATDAAQSVSGAIVDFEIMNASGQRVYQQFFTGQNFTAGQALTEQASWTPSDTGAYRAKVGIFATNWSSLLSWNDNAMAIAVAAPAPQAASVPAFATSVKDASAVTQGTQTSFSVSATNNGASVANAITDFEIMNASGQRVYQQFFTGQNFAANGTLTYSVSWTPSDAGTYTAKVGIFSDNWSSVIFWNDNAMPITVAAPAPAPVSVPAPAPAPASMTSTVAVANTAAPATQFSGTGSIPSSLAIGQSASLAGTVTNNTGASVNNAIVMLEVENAAGTNVFQQVFDGQNFAAGQAQHYTASWTPTTAGNYTLNIGVFAQNWSLLLQWIGGVGKTSVGTQLASATKFYVNASSSAALAVASLQAASDPTDAALVNVVAKQPVATWFGDWNANVEQDVSAVVKAAAAQGTTPILVAYNIPDRDCNGYSSGGAANAAAYQAWIQAFADGIGANKAMVILEPDALAQITCLAPADQAARLGLLSSAVTTLKSLGSTSVYLDAGNSNWVSASAMAPLLKGANVAAADGFALNVSNFYTTSDNEQYGAALSPLVGNKHFIVDTSRNGNGSLNGVWCNPSGRALGALPTTNTGNPLVDAFLWVKPAGESDGTCNGGPSAGVFWPQYAIGLAQQAGY